MNTSFLRDTQFGRLVRLLSGRRQFQYPDETDSSIWMKSFHRKRPTARYAQQGQDHDRDRPEELDSRNFDRSKDLEGLGQADLQDLNINHILGGGEEVYLIDWYGTDDPEVCKPLPSVSSTTRGVSAYTSNRIRTTGRADGNCSSLSRYVS